MCGDRGGVGGRPETDMVCWDENVNEMVGGIGSWKFRSW